MDKAESNFVFSVGSPSCKSTFGNSSEPPRRKAEILGHLKIDWKHHNNTNN